VVKRSSTPDSWKREMYCWILQSLVSVRILLRSSTESWFRAVMVGIRPISSGMKPNSRRSSEVTRSSMLCSFSGRDEKYGRFLRINAASD